METTLQLVTKSRKLVLASLRVFRGSTRVETAEACAKWTAKIADMDERIRRLKAIERGPPDGGG